MERRAVGLIIVFSAAICLALGLALMNRTKNRDESHLPIEGWPVAPSTNSNYRPLRTYEPSKLEQAVSAIENAAKAGKRLDTLSGLVDQLPQTIETPFADLLAAFVRLRKLPWEPAHESMLLSVALDSLLAYAGSPKPTQSEQAEVVAMVLRQAELGELADRGLILRHLAALDQWEKHHQLPPTVARTDLPKGVERSAEFARLVRATRDELAQHLDQRNPWTQDVRKQEPMTLAMLCGRRLANDPAAKEWRELRRTAQIVNAILVPVVTNAEDARSIKNWVNERVANPILLKGARPDLFSSDLEGLVVASDQEGFVVLVSDIGPELRGARSRRWLVPGRPDTLTFERINSDPPEQIFTSRSDTSGARFGSPRSGDGGAGGLETNMRKPKQGDETSWGLPIPETVFGP